ncbi:MAG: regulatory protein GemA [Rudaea sp.]|uniref:regulatory protein GemA n=1 Tax=unclassified Rudaea TaxID=2627037 RepID=UPI0010F6DD7C|nr:MULTISPECIES: regulatory protein GemA [unclassified Rudaea]MBN8885947.1 regulatory protein GemA [Rudaea sp.]MBR0347049.1 regulatory protein GemA [Rudaea sp.]
MTTRTKRKQGKSPKPTRTIELAKIHIGAQKLGLRTKFDDSGYRDMLWAIGRVRSAKDLDAAGRADVLEHLKGCGFKPAPKAGETRYKKGTPEALIRWLWTCLANAGVVRDGSDGALRRYIAQHARKSPHPSVTEIAPQHLVGLDANDVIEQLKAWYRSRDVDYE